MEIHPLLHRPQLLRSFGAYKYEVANQDHSLMLGVECVDNIMFGTEVRLVCWALLLPFGGRFGACMFGRA